MNNQELLEWLEKNADKKLSVFQASLIPNVGRLYGIRVPALKDLAKKISQGNWQEYLQETSQNSMEEVLLEGLVIAYAKQDIKEKLEAVAGFVPKISNWAICDSFCMAIKVSPKDKQKLWEFVLPYLEDEREYYIRFAVVVILSKFIDDEKLEPIFSALPNIKQGAYYVDMALAWAISVMFVKNSKKTLAFLQQQTMSANVHNKAIQKIVDSLRVAEKDKNLARGLRQKR